MKAEVSRLSSEKDQLNDKLAESNDEKLNLRNQINRLLAQPLDNIQKREELELTRQLRIDELEQKNQNLDQVNADLNQQLYKAEEKLLDLKFEKETYDLQYARLQKRI
jgi:predicted RNase H-like nuclease (RuvC/YqgF family)